MWSKGLELQNYFLYSALCCLWLTFTVMQVVFITTTFPDSIEAPFWSMDFSNCLSVWQHARFLIWNPWFIQFCERSSTLDTARPQRYYRYTAIGSPCTCFRYFHLIPPVLLMLLRFLDLWVTYLSTGCNFQQLKCRSSYWLCTVRKRCRNSESWIFLDSFFGKGLPTTGLREYHRFVCCYWGCYKTGLFKSFRGTDLSAVHCWQTLISEWSFF